MKNFTKIPLHFLGPKSENRPFFIEMMNLISNDYIFWRRNFHPSDPTSVSYKETQDEQNQEYREVFLNEMFKLLAELKLDPPFFSPRYMAHMISETTMASQLAYIATLLYNPNNVSSEASPVTIKYELEVGKQFAKLFGFNPQNSFGHITSGGTMANYQSLFYNLNLRFLPLSLALYMKAQNKEYPSTLPNNVWDLLNIPLEEFDKILGPLEIDEVLFENYTLSYLGLKEYENLVKEAFKTNLPALKIISSSTAHYSWKRAANLLNIGMSNILKVPLNQNFEIDVESFEEIVLECAQKKELLIQAIFVFGSTEFGSIDPIDKLVNVRNKLKDKIYFPIHIDAAYGGYFATMDKDQLSSYNFQNKKKGIGGCESVTVDPHKLGFCPYGAGAFIFKYGSLKRFLTIKANYCFDPKTTDTVTQDQLGQYILEGSKPGASAAGVYFNHKMISLDAKGFGAMISNLCYHARKFSNLLEKNSNSQIQLIPILEPQSNVVCFSIKRKETLTLSELNRITESVAAHFGVRDVKSIQEYDFIVSNTSFSLADFKETPKALDSLNIDTESIQLIRIVFMNQWYEKETKNGLSYMDEFIKDTLTFLEESN